MKRTEKLIAAITTIALGVLLIALKGGTVQVLTSIFGVMVLVLGVLDLVAKDTRMGLIKCVVGIFILAFGWVLLSAILYSSLQGWAHFPLLPLRPPIILDIRHCPE